MLRVAGYRDIEHPNVADIRMAVPDHAPPGHAVELVLPSVALAAEPLPEGGFALTREEGGGFYDAAWALGPEDLRELLVAAYLNAPGWRERVEWRVPPPATERAPGAKRGAFADQAAPPPWLLWASLTVAGAFILAFVLGPYGLRVIRIPPLTIPDVPLPALIDSTPARLILVFFLLLVAVFTVVAWFKSREVAAAPRGWSTGGVIRRSAATFDVVASGEQRLSDQKVATILYEYRVAGQRYRGSRVTFAEKQSEEDVTAALARYPVGARVIVHYDPNDPENAVLEREPPAAILTGCLSALLVGVVLLLIAMWLATAAVKGIDRAQAARVLPYVPALAGLVLVAFFVGFLRSNAKVKTWPTAPGTVLFTDLVGVREGTSESWRPVVEYGYTVDGVTHRSRSIQVDSVSSGSRGWAEGVLKRYPQGASVVVRYDPTNHGRAALETGLGLLWSLPVVAVFLVGLSAVFVLFGRT